MFKYNPFMWFTISIFSVDLVVYDKYLFIGHYTWIKYCDRMGKCIFFLFLVDFGLHGIYSKELKGLTYIYCNIFYYFAQKRLPY